MLRKSFMPKDNVMKDKIISDLNALFKARAEFYAFFDAHIPKVGQTAVFDFAKLNAINGASGADLASANCGENLANTQPPANSASKNSATSFNLANSGANSSQSANLEQIYKLFYHYDYAIRKLLPSLYKAYEIDSERDLSKDF